MSPIISGCVSVSAFASNLLREYIEMRKEIKNSETSVEYII